MQWYWLYVRFGNIISHDTYNNAEGYYGYQHVFIDVVDLAQ